MIDLLVGRVTEKVDELLSQRQADRWPMAKKGRMDPLSSEDCDPFSHRLRAIAPKHWYVQPQRRPVGR